MININPSTPQLAIVKKWLESYTSLDTKNTELLLSKDFQYESLPKSSNAPDESKKAHTEIWGERYSSMNKLEITTHEVVEAPGKVVVLGTAVYKTSDGGTLPYDFVVIVTLVEEDGGLKILNCKSFADIEQRGAVFTWAAKAQAQRSTVS